MPKKNEKYIHIGYFYSLKDLIENLENLDKQYSKYEYEIKVYRKRTLLGNWVVEVWTKEN